MANRKWKGYQAEKKNELVLLINDKCFDGTTTPVMLKSPEDADAFMEAQIKFLAQHGFELNSFGSTDAMLARFDKKAYNHALTEVLNILDKNPQTPTEKLSELILRLKK